MISDWFGRVKSGRFKKARTVKNYAESKGSASAPSRIMNEHNPSHPQSTQSATQASTQRKKSHINGHEMSGFENNFHHSHDFGEFRQANFPHHSNYHEQSSFDQGHIYHDRPDHENLAGHGRGSASFASDIVKLSAGLMTAGLFGLMIAFPLAGDRMVQKITQSGALSAASLSERECSRAEGILTADFTDFENVLSISPLGGITAPGEILPAPYVGINTKTNGSPFERLITPVKAPAKSEIVAIERRIIRSASGNAAGISWSIYMKPCADIIIVYDRVDELQPGLIDKVGGLTAFSEIGTPDHSAVKLSMTVDAGTLLGQANGFDVSLHDKGAEPQMMARPERYWSNSFVRAELFNLDPSLMEIISPDHTQARCALDYMRREQDREAWSGKLGDAWGIRRARGQNACRTALIDLPGTLQGAWYTNAAHNGATTKVSAIALAPDAINPDRLIFSFHGRLSSLTQDLINNGPAVAKPITENVDSDSENTPRKAEKVHDFITFERGNGAINRPFDEITDTLIYCYEDLRVKFVGPRVNGVLLLQNTRQSGEEILKIEARPEFSSCMDLPEGVSLTGNATGFFR